MSTRLAAAAVALIASAYAAAASPVAPGSAPQPASPITDYFALRMSYFQPGLTTAGRFDSDAGIPGTPFNAEAELGLDNEANQGRIELAFRMRDRHLLRVDYFKLNRYGENTLTRQIDFRNRVFRVNDRVATNLDWRMLGFNYSYGILRRENFEICISLQPTPVPRSVPAISARPAVAWSSCQRWASMAHGASIATGQSADSSATCR